MSNIERMGAGGGLDMSGAIVAGSLRNQKSIFKWAVCLAYLVTVLLLPLTHFYISFSDLNWSMIGPRHYVHVALNSLCNLLCLTVALRVRGSHYKRLRAGLSYTLLLHGGLIVLLFSARLYYSRSAILIAFLASAVLVAVVSIIVEKLRPQRIGVIATGMTDEFFRWLGSGAKVVPSPDANLDDYDIIVWNYLDPLDQAWCEFVSRAILADRDVQHIAKYVEDRNGRVSESHFSPYHVARVPDGLYQKVFKRLLDVVIALVLLVLTSPVMLVAIMLIWVQMGRPIFFSQMRVGIGGKPFRIWKLRTMKANSVSDTEATVVRDPRITPLGRILRRTRIDELPQLYNVLLGEMSIVGPRPEQPILTDRYIAAIPAFQYRSIMRPGLTGWAQVRAPYASDEAASREKLMHDLYYLKNVSLLLDLWILLATIRAIAKGTSVR